MRQVQCSRCNWGNDIPEQLETFRCAVCGAEHERVIPGIWTSIHNPNTVDSLGIPTELPPKAGPLRATVTFGPSRSPNYARAVDYAQRHAQYCHDLNGRIMAGLTLAASDPPAFGHLARLVDFTQNWRGTDVEIEGNAEVPWVVVAMGFCAQSYARSWGECVDTKAGHLSKCRACPMAPAPAPRKPPRFAPDTGHPPALGSG